MDGVDKLNPVDYVLPQTYIYKNKIDNISKTIYYSYSYVCTYIAVTQYALPTSYQLYYQNQVANMHIRSYR